MTIGSMNRDVAAQAPADQRDRLAVPGDGSGDHILQLCAKLPRVARVAAEAPVTDAMAAAAQVRFHHAHRAGPGAEPGQQQDGAWQRGWGRPGAQPGWHPAQQVERQAQFLQGLESAGRSQRFVSTTSLSPAGRARVPRAIPRRRARHAAADVGDRPVPAGLPPVPAAGPARRSVPRRSCGAGRTACRLRCATARARPGGPRSTRIGGGSVNSSSAISSVPWPCG